MYDLLFAITLVLPLVAPYLAGQWMSRDFGTLSAEARAQRSYRLSWFISFCMLAQFGLPIWIVSQWGDSMQLAGVFANAFDSGDRVLREYLSPGFAVAFVTTLTMLVIIANSVVMCVPHFRVMRLGFRLSV